MQKDTITLMINQTESEKLLYSFYNYNRLQNKGAIKLLRQLKTSPWWSGSNINVFFHAKFQRVWCIVTLNKNILVSTECKIFWPSVHSVETLTFIGKVWWLLSIDFACSLLGKCWQVEPITGRSVWQAEGELCHIRKEGLHLDTTNPGAIDYTQTKTKTKIHTHLHVIKIITKSSC